MMPCAWSFLSKKKLSVFISFSLYCYNRHGMHGNNARQLQNSSWKRTKEKQTCGSGNLATYYVQEIPSKHDVHVSRCIKCTQTGMIRKR